MSDMKKEHIEKQHHQDFRHIIAPVDGSRYAIKAMNEIKPWLGGESDK